MVPRSALSVRLAALCATLAMPALVAAADGSSSLLAYLLTSLSALLVGLVLLYVATLAYRWARSAAPRPELAPLPAREGESPFDFRLLDVVSLAPEIVVYFVKLGSRVLLLASRDGNLVSLGDFPLAWAFPEEQPELPADYHLAGRYGAPAATQTAHPPRPPRERDSRAWQAQRRALLESLRNEELP
ncbi:MAG: hypothetical protein J7M26_08990 [Armatimonadetes bacterium]|nr:hypothetical protein [Armatimonadota bacterium]